MTPSGEVATPDLMSSLDPGLVARAAEAIRSARVLVVMTGAGMGVDSGLPDFRGPAGFWKAYPPYERLGLTFERMASPEHFRRDSALGWGFYGHRAALYRSVRPHEGYRILLSWADRLGLEIFSVTSNVDGHFQTAGFPDDRVLEIHGSIHHLQCAEPCSRTVWPSREEVPVDETTMRALRIPRCIRCGMVCRPNILMFGDWGWIEDRTAEQEARYLAFLERHATMPFVVIEAGAGTAIASIRMMSEALGTRHRAAILRVNPREPWVRSPHVSLPCGALEALTAIDRAL